MYRQKLLKLLDEYKEQQFLKKKFVEFIENHTDCFERSNEYGHMTASSWLVNNSGDKVLLTHHRKLDMWLQPGGHCDGDADVASVALKEAQEETGIQDWKFKDRKIFDIDCHVIPARKSEPQHYHFDVRFVMVAQSNENYVVSEESHDLARVPLKSLADYTTEESIVRMAEKWYKLKAEPAHGVSDA
ncbi:MAG: NUDIX hydrolase [Lentisphaerales bacterium]|nr:NUDIX hydrolase [Lentisphaerales bacterium]